MEFIDRCIVCLAGILLGIALVNAFKPNKEPIREQEYTVIRASSIEDLESMINDKLEAGWHIEGGIRLEAYPDLKSPTGVSVLIFKEMTR